MRWRELNNPTALAALERVLAAWDRTPYREGQDKKGAGVDCVRYVGRLLDELRGKPPTPIITLRGDAAMHSFARAAAVVESLKVSFDPVEQIRDGILEPGDIVVLAYGGGPTHAAIVGPKRGTLWEAGQPHVRMVGTATLDRNDTQLYRHYRPLDKSEWK